MASYVPDGYVDNGHVAAIPGLHDALRFRYRRALGWENAEARRAASQLKPREAEAHWAKFLKAKLVDWDLRDPDGRSVELTEAHILRMNPTLNEAVLAIVMSARASDYDPERPEPADATPAAEREAADAKN